MPAPRFRTAPVDGRQQIRLEVDDGVLWTRAGEGFAGRGEAARFDCGAGADRFERAENFFREFLSGCDVTDDVGRLGSGPLAFATFTFDPDEPGSVLVIPRRVAATRDGSSWTTVADEAGEFDPTPIGDFGRVRYAGASLSELEWLDAVARVERAVRGDGPLDKVVLARDISVWAEGDIDPRVVTRRLADRFPECFTFYCAGLIGATPELLLRRTGRVVQSVVLAGSAPRGRSDEEDERIGDGLLASAKDVHEHRLAVQSVTATLGDVCSALDVTGPRLLKLANVQHLSTQIEGTLIHERSSLTLAGMLHPTAAVGGVPRTDALHMIHEVEGMRRGRYAGPVGWMDARGDGEWGIALRCAELDGPRGRLFAGAGIVAGSLPEAELEETRLKLRAMQSVLSPDDERYSRAP